MVNEKEVLENIISINKVPILTEDEIDEQARNIVCFLQMVYPYLAQTSNSWEDGCIEIRPIQRSGAYTFVNSFNTWRISKDTIEYLKDFLKKVNGKAFCIYYSIFTFDYNKEIIDSKTKKPKRKGKINKENALYTTMLAADFDDMDYNNFKFEKERLLGAGIDTIDISTGHGYQSIIMLDKKVYDKDILKKFTALLLRKGFKADSKIIDPARVLRLPYTYNCKACDKNSKYYNSLKPEIIATKVTNWSFNKYGVDEVFEKLNKLPDNFSIPASDTINIKNEILKKNSIDKDIKKKTMVEVKDTLIKIEDLKSVYSNLLDIEFLPIPIKRMLAGTEEGMRNSVMLFIIPFLRNSLGLDIKAIKQIMCAWGKYCTPKLDANFIINEVDRIYGYNFKGKHGIYTAELYQNYGYLEFKSYKRDNKIIIPNMFFQDYYLLSDCTVKIYLAIKIANKVDGIEKFTKDTIINYLNVSERTLERNLKSLIKYGYICKKRMNRRTGESYIYYLNPYFSSTKGYTSIENATIEVLFKCLNDNEIKLYIYMCYMIGNKHGNDCWASQSYLAKKIGKKDHSTITRCTNSMQDKHYIKKTTYKKDGVIHCIYNLNY